MLSPQDTFEMQVAELYQTLGHRIQRVVCRRFQTTDLVLQSDQGERWVVRCEQRETVTEATVRHLLSVMEAERAKQGVLITTGLITHEALNFAQAFPIHILDLSQFQQHLRQARSLGQK